MTHGAGRSKMRGGWVPAAARRDYRDPPLSYSSND